MVCNLAETGHPLRRIGRQDATRRRDGHAYRRDFTHCAGSVGRTRPVAEIQFAGHDAQKEALAFASLSVVRTTTGHVEDRARVEAARLRTPSDQLRYFLAARHSDKVVIADDFAAQRLGEGDDACLVLMDVSPAGDEEFGNCSSDALRRAGHDGELVSEIVDVAHSRSPVRRPSLTHEGVTCGV